MRGALKTGDFSIVIRLATGLLCGVAILGVRGIGLLQQLELDIYDWLLRSRPAAAVSESRITYITISEEDIRRQGRWPVTDETLAHALRLLLDYQPRAIGVDVYRDIEVPPGHEKLTALLPQHPQIVMITHLGGGTVSRIPPPSVLQGSPQVGFNDILVDFDGIIRRGLLFQDDGDDVAYAFGLRLAMLYLAQDGIVPEQDPAVPEWIRLGRITLRPFASSDGSYVNADDGGYQILLDFGAAGQALDTFSLTDLLEGRIEARYLTNRIVMIGVTAESVPDVFQIPVNYGSYGSNQFPGVIMHGIITEQLLAAAIDGRSPLRGISELAEISWTLLWGMLGGALGSLARSAWRFSFIVLGGLFLITLSVVALFFSGWWMPLGPPASTWIIAVAIGEASTLAREWKDKARLMQLFSRHVSREVADKIWQERDYLLEDGRPRPQEILGTVLFSDFKGYTKISEQLTPQALMDWVNSYLSAMTGIIMDHGGVIDDYAGDSIKANFGVPIKRETQEEVAKDAVSAVACALAMEEELLLLNNHHALNGLPTVGMRIGIHTGPLLAGCVGSAHRMKYTTVGDTVNAAAHLESFGREAIAESQGRRPCRILVSESTAQLLGNRFQLDCIGEVHLKGKTQSMLAYRIVTEMHAQSDTSSEGAAGD
ncbi:MAG: adenylate/guanylate cyclase domain-containing protein [Nitrospira sp.]|nr:adenylate/guanylate cyclase domain-containing protein [Nitrospira sp.]